MTRLLPSPSVISVLATKFLKGTNTFSHLGPRQGAWFAGATQKPFLVSTAPTGDCDIRLEADQPNPCTMLLDFQLHCSHSWCDAQRLGEASHPGRASHPLAELCIGCTNPNPGGLRMKEQLMIDHCPGTFLCKGHWAKLFVQ